MVNRGGGSSALKTNPVSSIQVSIASCVDITAALLMRRTYFFFTPTTGFCFASLRICSTMERGAPLHVCSTCWTHQGWPLTSRVFQQAHRRLLYFVMPTHRILSVLCFSNQTRLISSGVLTSASQVASISTPCWAFQILTSDGERWSGPQPQGGCVHAVGLSLISCLPCSQPSDRSSGVCVHLLPPLRSARDRRGGVTVQTPST